MDLSANTQAILLLTAPLMFGKARAKVAPLTPGEYATLARALREVKRQPADLLGPGNSELMRAALPALEPARLEQLLARGFLLSQALEHWRSRAIWVVSRADGSYPRRLKQRLGDEAPAVLYGCGDVGLLDAGGLAVAGSRKTGAALTAYAEQIGRLSAAAALGVVCGGAKGIEQAALRGALQAGGRVACVLAHALEKAVMNREYRQHLIDGQLVLICPCDPAARFDVGHAMQRNKLIYALADAALIVSAELRQGGTWAGAAEQLETLKFVPLFVRSAGKASAGLDGLRARGALDWPEPVEPDALRALVRAHP